MASGIYVITLLNQPANALQLMELYNQYGLFNVNVMDCGFFAYIFIESLA
jgi:hypothetical protein